MEIKLLSWNVNGLRAVSAKEDWKWFEESDAHIIGLQETKAAPHQLSDNLVHPEGWHATFASSTVKKGYSGVAAYSRIEPITTNIELDHAAYGGEGRLVHLEFPWFHYFTVYFPNGGAQELNEAGKPIQGKFKRVPYKMGFFEAFLQYAEELRKTKPIVVCGDFNIAHAAMDLARPKQNTYNTGYLAEERAFLDSFVDAGYVDTFRLVHGESEGDYTWWSYKSGARQKNIGWRIDYFFVSNELQSSVKDAWIESHVYGSDHCPVGLLLEV